MEALGRITAPGGVLVIGDMGYLGDWSGDDEPPVPALLREQGGDVAPRVDFAVVGPDAEAAARAFDRQPLTFLYDIPDPGGLRALWDEMLAGRDFDAELVAEPLRIGHRERARRAAAAGGGEFSTDGVTYIAVPVADAGPFDVVGQRYDDDTWATVTVRLGE